MPGPFYKANVSALCSSALTFFWVTLGDWGIIIQATHLIQPHNLPLMQTTSKTFSDWFGGFRGVTQQDYVSNILSSHASFWDVLLGCVKGWSTSV